MSAVTGVQRLPDWDQLGTAIPDVVAPMRRYLQQLTAILRPGSVSNADQALRSLAAFLAEQAPDVRFVADIRRHHIEDFRIWLAARPGQRTARLTPASLAHRLGTLRMFFVRISDWDWPEAPTRVPIIPADLPRQDHPLPKALDDPAAAKLLRAAQIQPRMLVRVVVEVLLRTGLRVGEFTTLRADAVVLIGAAHWLHVPVGKLHEDRYLPLHPHLVTLIDDYRTRYVAADNPLLLPRESGTALDRHTVTRLINKASAAAGLPHIHPHQLRHTLATQAFNRRVFAVALSLIVIALFDAAECVDEPVDNRWITCLCMGVT
jgi:site-specific recombinase XerD